MDQIGSLITVDWRTYGDFSAVGQLTKKLFSQVKCLKIIPITVINSEKCRIHKLGSNQELSPYVPWDIYQDAAVNQLRHEDVCAIYVRLSPHKETLEFAIKLSIKFPHAKLIVHFMDTPHLESLRRTQARYISTMYDYLIKKADTVYCIHESNVSWIREKYSCNASVLGNFIKHTQRPSALKTLSLKKNKKIKLNYFGSIDKKMNAASILSVANVVKGKPWLELNIWSNSGVWGDLKTVGHSADNITVNPSDLSEEDYQRKIKEADLLLLPYNCDSKSAEFLSNSYSNKFIDYLEVGGKVLAIGPPDIPTIRECKENRLAVVVSSQEQLQDILASPERLEKAIQETFDSDFNNRLQRLEQEKFERVIEFKKDLEMPVFKEASRKTQKTIMTTDDYKLQLSFLIKRKFYDKITGQQSLSATVASELLKKKGYTGFDYEV